VGTIKSISQKRADELAAIVAAVEDNATALLDVVAELQDEDTKGDDRRDKTADLAAEFGELCSNVRALAAALGLSEVA
jgi:hypothetical protein